MNQTLEKTVLAQKLPDSRTAHLQPVIDFLKEQGNAPAQPGFTFDRDGYGTCYFEKPLDMELLKARFAFPDTILLTKDAVQDSRNFVGITQRIPLGPVLTFGA